MDDDSWLTVARNRLRTLYSNLGIWWYNVILNLDMNELGNGRTQTGIENFPYNGGGRHLGTGGIGNLGTRTITSHAPSIELLPVFQFFPDIN